MIVNDELGLSNTNTHVSVERWRSYVDAAHRSDATSSVSNDYEPKILRAAEDSCLMVTQD